MHVPILMLILMLVGKEEGISAATAETETHQYGQKLWQ